MSYNRWMPQEYQSGGELYHYGVKGMKWKNKKGLQIETHEATITGGSLPTDENGGPKWYDESKQRSEQEQADAAYRRYQEVMEARKPAWQKKWDRSSAKKTLNNIMSKIKSKTSKAKKPKKKKSRLKVTFSDGTSKDL